MRLLFRIINPLLGLLLLLQGSVLSANDLISARFSTSNIKPWGFINQQGLAEGLLVTLAESLEKESGITIRNQIRPYPRVIHEIAKGSVDFAVMFESPQAAKIGISLGRVVDTHILLVGLPNTPTVDDINELRGRSIGYIRGSKYGGVFDNSQAFDKVSVGSMKQGINMLLKRRIYAMASADQTFYYALRELNIPRHQVTPIMVLNTTSADLYFSRASTQTHLIEPLRSALNALKEKGVLNSIFYENGYYPEQALRPDFNPQ